MICSSRLSDLSQIVSQQDGFSPTPTVKLALRTCAHAQQPQRDEAPAQPWSQKRKAHVLARFRGSRREPSQVDAGVSAVVSAARLRSRSRGLRPDEMAAAAGSAGSATDGATGRALDPGHVFDSLIPHPAEPVRAKSWQQRCAAAARCGRRALARPGVSMVCLAAFRALPATPDRPSPLRPQPTQEKRKLDEAARPLIAPAQLAAFVRLHSAPN
jgi:hypothetical protein